MKPTFPGSLLTLAAVALALTAHPSARAGEVVSHRNLPYVANPHERQQLDVHVPAEGEGLLPLIVWVHGGAWLGGSKDDCPPLQAGWVRADGFVVASINYRLSSHATFPAQIEDCKAAIRWLRAHAAAYRIDPDRIGVWGSSAGGHLVALLGTCSDDRTFDVGENLEYSSAVQAVCDYFGPTDFVQMNGHRPPGATFDHDGADSPESQLIGGAIQLPENAARVQRANPITYVTAGDPPFLLVHGDEDPLVPHHQSELLYAALTGAAVPVRFITVAGGGHGNGFPHNHLHAVVREFFRQRLLLRAPEADTARSRRETIAATAN